MMSKSVLSIILLVALAMRFAGGDIANLSYLVLAYYALLGRSQVIQALALLWFFSCINPFIASEATLASICRYIPIGSSIISLFLRSQVTDNRSFITLSRPVLVTLTLGAFMFIHSMFLSEMPDVSILKTVSWMAVMLVLLSAWRGLDYQARTLLERQLFGGLGLLMLISLPLAFTDIGYANNKHGFQGLLNQSQVFGIAMAVLGSWLIGRLSEVVRYRWIYMALLGINLVLIIMSETRTAGFALIIATAGAAFFFYFFRLTIRSSIRVFVVASILMVIGSTQSGPLRDYIFKYDNVNDIVEIAEASRGVLVYPMIDNIVNQPMTGIGFGVASTHPFRWVDRESVFGLPTGAPVEKGIMPLAVLEEIGVPGLLVVIAWLWMIIRRAINLGFSAFVIVSTLLLMNLGESSLFSIGGNGLFFLILLAWVITGKGYAHKGSIIKSQLCPRWGPAVK